MGVRQRLDRLVRVARAGRSNPPTAKEVWLPAEPGGDPPGRYPSPSGWVVLIRYPPEDDAAEEVR